MLKKLLLLLLIGNYSFSMQQDSDINQELISKIKWMVATETKNPNFDKFQNLTLTLTNRVKVALGEKVIKKFNKTWDATDAYDCIVHMHDVRGDILSPTLTKYIFVGKNNTRAIFNDEIIDFYISKHKTVSMHPIAFCALVFHHYHDELEKLLIERVAP